MIRVEGTHSWMLFLMITKGVKVKKSSLYKVVPIYIKVLLNELIQGGGIEIDATEVLDSTSVSSLEEVSAELNVTTSVSSITIVSYHSILSYFY